MSTFPKPYTHQNTTTVIAAATFDKHLFVTPAGAVCGAGAMAYGISYIDADNTLPVGLVRGGNCLLKIKATIAVGDEIMSDATGYGVVATAGKFVGAVALEAGATGDTILVAPVLYIKPAAAT